jgi:hypothetical protein
MLRSDVRRVGTGADAVYDAWYQSSCVNAGEWIRDVATPVAVLLTAAQLYFNRLQAKASFEDDMTREYRAITGDLPSDAFHTDADTSVKLTEPQRNALFRYFDLSNEQLRLADEQKRVSKPAARAWREGICDNMMLPRFRRAFEELAVHLPQDDQHPYFSWLRPVAEEAARDADARRRTGNEPDA